MCCASDRMKAKAAISQTVSAIYRVLLHRNTQVSAENAPQDYFAKRRDFHSAGASVRAAGVLHT